MKFTGSVKPVKADLTKQTITIAFEIDKTDGAMAEAEQLAFYADKDAGLVDVLVTPRQLRMFTPSRYPAGNDVETRHIASSKEDQP